MNMLIQSHHLIKVRIYRSGYTICMHGRCYPRCAG